MSAPTRNQDVLEAANAAVERGDHDGFLSYCTDDTVWEFVGDRTLRGPDEVREWMRESYPEPPRNRVDRFVSDGDSLVATGEIEVLENGEWVSHRYCDVWRLRGGLLAELTAFVV